MDQASASPRRFGLRDDRAIRNDWLRDGLASGFIATFAMTASMAAAFAIANTLGNAGGNTIERWFAALSSNELTDNVGDVFAIGMMLNLVMGLVWALIYARFAEPRLTGPGWGRGALFALIPWALSILVFFPVAGIGILGTGVEAGILPVLGNLILHLVFGGVLGALYDMEGSSDSHDRQANTNSERSAAIGMLTGGVLGFIGGWLVAPGMDNIANQPVIAFAGALSGAAIGMLIGSLLGLKVDDERG